ncbi:POK9 protein, partial [Nyctibius bracteatus]|nr:POK9 protein [Nyctibius bracteatus]
QYRRLQSPLGKRPDERAPQSRLDTNNSEQCECTALQPATAGSLGLDLAAAVETTLATTRPQKISTGIKGPICINGEPYGALLLGRSSTSIMGLFVLPGIVDPDYQGEIQIMAYTLFPPLVIPQGQRIAQLIPLPHLTKGLAPHLPQQRGEGGFGSTGAAFLTLDLHRRPKRPVTLVWEGQHTKVEGLLDTGADVSIISPEWYPPRWPSKASMDTVSGVGGFTLAKKTPLLTVWIEKQAVTTVLSIVQLPPGVQCLVGRDILAQMGLVL